MSSATSDPSPTALTAVQSTCSPRLPFSWAAVLVGVVVTAVSLILLSALGWALGSSVFDLGPAGSDRARLIAVWAVPGAIAAFALGGWAAAKAAADPGGGPIYGLLVGASALVLLLVLAGPRLAAMADPRSVGIALGLVDAPDVGTGVSRALDRLTDAAPGGDGPPAATILPTALAHVRTTSWYAVGLLVAMGAAAVLGGKGGGTGSRGGVGYGFPSALRRVSGLVVAMALAGVLTAWLWPSLWAVGVAVVDIDQSAGPEVGVNLTEVAQHPEVMWGESVTISGRVDRIIGPRALLLGNDKPSVGNRVLVVGRMPLADLVTLAETGGTAIREGDVAQVTGVVRPFDAGQPDAQSGLDLASTGAVGYDGRAVLVAHAIDLDVPIAAPAGDKEFGAGSAGYDRGVTTDDVVYRPDEYLGQTVTVSDEVEEHLLTPHAFLLGDRALLAVSAQPRPELFVEATAYVTGEVRRLDLGRIEAELGIDLDDDLLRPHEGEPVIVVRSVMLVA